METEIPKRQTEVRRAIQQKPSIQNYKIRIESKEASIINESVANQYER